jgi:hypothetical protein
MVDSGQYVVVTVQFAPTTSTPDTCKATLLITGDTWNPVSVAITATVGEVKAKVPAIFVDQGKSTTVDVTVTLVAGAATTAKLLIDADGSSAAPNVTVSLTPSSLSLTKGVPKTAKLKVSAESTLAAGEYTWSLAVWSFDNTSSFSIPVNITVGVPYYAIKSKLDGTLIDIAGASTKSGTGLDAYPEKLSDNDNQLWNFVPDPDGSGCYYIVSKLNGDVIDIQGASKEAGALLDAYPKKSSADNQLWYFVADPEGSGYCFIVSKLNGNVIDIQKSSTISGAALDSYPVKFTNYQNQLWKVVGGSFPSVVQTVRTPPGNLLNGNSNYFLDSGGDALYGLSVSVKFTSDFVSSANGYSFQLNCYSTEGPTITTEWQQYVIYASPGDTQLYARIDTWADAKLTDELNRIDAPLANLPTPTIPEGYSFNIALTYLGDSAIVTGATYTVTDSSGKSVGSTTITIVGNSLRTTGAPATEANLAPVAAFQFTIGGDYGSTRATLTGGTGKVTYVSPVGLAAQGSEPSYTAFGTGTAENANLQFGFLPWPWSVSMDSEATSTSVVQLFEAVSGLGAPLVAISEGIQPHALPPPDDRSLGRHAMKSSGR